MSRPAPASLTAHSTCIIGADSDLRGTITLGANVIIHPRATIYAAGGPIVFGEGCIVEEGSVIINRGKETMRIGDHNHFMVGCRIESPSIGHYNTFQPRSTACVGVMISNHCVLSAGTTLVSSPNQSEEALETLQPYTVIFGADSARRIWDGSGQQAELTLRQNHAEYLREIIPKYNRLRATA